MKRITNKQTQEIEFLSNLYKIIPSEEEVKQYLLWTTKGLNKDENPKSSKNCLFQAKRRWDIQLKMYRQGWEVVSKEELIEDFNHPYATKCISKL